MGGHPGSTRPAVDLLRFLRLLLIEISFVFSVALKFGIRVPKSAAHFTSRLSFDPVASIHAEGYAQGVPLPSLADASPFGAQLPPAAVPPVACLEAPELSKALRPGGCRGKVWGGGGSGWGEVGGVGGCCFFHFLGCGAYETCGSCGKIVLSRGARMTSHSLILCMTTMPPKCRYLRRKAASKTLQQLTCE